MGIGYWFMGIGLLVIWIVSITAWVIYTGIIGVFTYGWYSRKKDEMTATGNFRINVSVIVAARDEEDNIAGLLDDLSAQDYSRELLEVIVIDDHSKDNTAGTVSEFISLKQLSGFRLIVNDDPGKTGKKAAITLGIAESGGDLILTTDADCRVGRGWVSAMIAQFADESKEMVFGPVSYFPRKGIMNNFQSLEFYGLTASGAGAALAGHPFICSGACLAYRKRAFLAVNGFTGNESIISGDDVFLMHKMKKAFGNQAIAFSRDKRALVQTYPVRGFLAFFKQRIRWASKSKGYNDSLSIMTAFIVFSYSLTVLFSLIAGIFNAWMFIIFGGLLILKMITDLPLMWGVTGFTGSRKLLKWYIPFQVIYPFYVVVAGVVSFFPRRKW